MDKLPLKLPSGCKIYDKVDPDKLFIRTLRGRDEKLIAEISKDNYEKKFTQILGNCVEGIDVSKLTLGDRKYVMLWLAINSYSSNHTIDFMCEHCLSKLQLDVDLSAVQIKTLPEGFSEPCPISLSDGKVVNLRLFRVQDELKLAELEKSGQNTWNFRWALTIVGDMPFMEKVEMLENMETKDIAKIRAFHEENTHGPVMETKYECEKCGGEGVTPIPFRFELFFPYGDRLTRYFGKAS